MDLFFLRWSLVLVLDGRLVIGIRIISYGQFKIREENMKDYRKYPSIIPDLVLWLFIGTISAAALIDIFWVAIKIKQVVIG